MALVVGDVRHLRLILGLDIVDIGLVRWRWVVFFFFLVVFCLKIAG